MDNPLVSIIVITYNSSKYVLETLESAKAQTYRNIELIVSDDCSTDNTVELVEIWIEENNNFFKRCIVSKAITNTGIPANCNRGVNLAEGEWIKLIAGDDIMHCDFISKCKYVFSLASDIGACFTNSFIINSNSQVVSKVGTENYKSGYIFEDIFFLKFWPKAPAFLFKRDVLIDVGLFDETIWVEDYLLIMKISKKYRIEHVNEYLVYYRLHGNNIGSPTIKLANAHLQSIAYFSDYTGYQKRKKEMLLQRLAIAAKTDKKFAIVELFKNIDQFLKFLYIKSIILLLFYWPALIESKADKKIFNR